jgi:hypothetical protein
MARKVRQIRRKGKAIGIGPVPATAAQDLDTRIEAKEYGCHTA